jgi:hypothetical protein
VEFKFTVTYYKKLIKTLVQNRQKPLQYKVISIKRLRECLLESMAGLMGKLKKEKCGSDEIEIQAFNSLISRE